MPNKICVFFGHSQITTDPSAALERAIRDAVENRDVGTFWCGGYGAFDRRSAWAAHAMKQEYPHIEVLLIRAYLPAPGEPKSELYNGSVYPNGLETVPQWLAIVRRNEWMAKGCDLAILYVNYDFGGAYEAARVVARAKKPMINLGTLGLG